MLNSQAFAQAVAIVTGAVFVICRLLSAITPQFIFTVGQSWFHTINLGSVAASSGMTVSAFILGLASSVVVSWLMAYAVAELYNRFTK